MARDPYAQKSNLFFFLCEREQNIFFPQIVRDASSTNTLERIEEYISTRVGEKFQFHRLWLGE
jgi:transposase